MTTQTLPARRWILDLSAAALLLSVGIAGFIPTFDGPGLLLAAGGATALGLGIAALGARLRWGILLVSLTTVAVYFLFGGVLALPATTAFGVVPTLDTLVQLGLRAVTSWKQLLTTPAPVAVSDGHLVVPFLLTLVAAVVTGSLALRARPMWALVSAGAYLVIEIALGTSEPSVPIAQGVVFAVVAVVWVAIRQAWEPQAAVLSIGDDAAPKAGRVTRRVLAGTAVVAVAALAGVGFGAMDAPASTRYVLRDVIIPPFDIREYPSPLQSFRAYVRDDAEESLFRVSGLPDGARVRLATMDAYSGMVYNVSDDGAGSSSAFTPVRGNMSDGAEGTPVTLHVDIDAYDGVWMPETGAVVSVEFDGDRSAELRRAAHYNESTGTGVVTARLETGDAYTLETVLPSERSDESLASAEFAPVAMPEQRGVPQELGDIAAKAVADATTPIEQVRALEAFLAEGGFFSHGLEGEVLSRAGHGAERILTLVGAEQMIGDDEQYATAMALLAGQVGIPARVVMGFHPDEDAADEGVFTATGDNLHAWVEVAFEGAGWLPFDPTPPEDQIPTDQAPKPRADPKPQVLQPPPPEQEPVDLPPTVPDERESEDDEAADAGPLWAIIGFGAAGLGILLLLVTPFIVIGALKATRRRRRRLAERASDRISGGWEELVDRAVDHGAPIRPGATRHEDAAVVGDAFAEPRVTTLAHRADAGVFGPAEPSPADIDEFWRQVDEIVGGMGARRSPWRRLRARLTLRSLLADTRFALPPRRPADVAPVAADENPETR